MFCVKEVYKYGKFIDNKAKVKKFGNGRLAKVTTQDTKIFNDSAGSIGYSLECSNDEYNRYDKNYNKIAEITNRRAEYKISFARYKLEKLLSYTK